LIENSRNSASQEVGFSSSHAGTFNPSRCTLLALKRPIRLDAVAKHPKNLKQHRHMLFRVGKSLIKT
jgi:hypothetical protein